MKHIVCFHLYNDYSGSPKVLNMVLEGLLEKGYVVDLVSSRGGPLDKLSRYENLHKHSYSYHFSTRRWVTTVRYSLVQLYTFLLAFRWLFSRDVVFYVNTLLPVGPALAGRIMGKRVVYHYHENAFVKGRAYKMLAAMMQRLAHEIICVSQYQASLLTRKEGVTVIPNALPKIFVEKLHPDAQAAFNRKTVLMLSSLKKYKGTQEFIELASRLPQYKFVLVINDKQKYIDSFHKHHSSQKWGMNLTVLSRMKDVTPFYNQASIALNLTDKTRCVETFGLTALEAMGAGLPVIVPTEGGIAEMVEDDVNGYKIDVQEMDRIATCIQKIMTEKETYMRLAEQAHVMSEHYSYKGMTRRIEEVLGK